MPNLSCLQVQQILKMSKPTELPENPFLILMSINHEICFKFIIIIFPKIRNASLYTMVLYKVTIGVLPSCTHDILL